MECWCELAATFPTFIIFTYYNIIRRSRYGFGHENGQSGVQIGLKFTMWSVGPTFYALSHAAPSLRVVKVAAYPTEDEYQIVLKKYSKEDISPPIIGIIIGVKLTASERNKRRTMYICIHMNKKKEEKK